MKLKSCLLLLIILPVITGYTIINAKPLPRFGGYVSVGKSEVDGSPSDIDDLNYSAGIQVMAFYGFLVFMGYGYGVDAGYTQLYYDKISDSRVNYFKIVPYLEIELFSVTLQAGAGPYMGIGDETCLGFMLNWGFTIPFPPYLLIHLMGKTEWIQAEQNISTLGFHIGFSYIHD